MMMRPACSRLAVHATRWTRIKPSTTTTTLQLARFARHTSSARPTGSGVKAAATQPAPLAAAGTPLSAAPPAPSSAAFSVAPLASAGTPAPAPSASTDGFLVRRLNESIGAMPLETVASLALMEGLSFSVTNALLKSLDITFPTLFAVAFVVSMPLRRATLPKLSIAVPLTWLLAKVAPPLTRVHLIRLSQGASPRWTPAFMLRRRERKRIEAEAAAEAARAAGQPVPAPPAPSRFALRIAALSDRYGLALLISYRLAGFCIINGVYFALLYGVDITPLLHYMGVTQDVNAVSTVASYAAAVTMSALWFPLTVFLSPWPAQVFHSIRKFIFPNKTEAEVAPTTAAIIASDNAIAESVVEVTGAALSADATSSDAPAATSTSGSGEQASTPPPPPPTKAFALLLTLFGTAAANAADDEAAATSSLTHHR